MTSWRDTLIDEWSRRRRERQNANSLFPLIGDGFDGSDIIAAADALLSGQITMAERVRQFEKEFAQLVGAPFAVMVNSGSSANLLAIAAMSNPARRHPLLSGEEVLIPAVCWPTSLWPIVQMGLKPVFVDVDPKTLNMDPRDLRRRISESSRAILCVHILGNAAPMGSIMETAREYGLLLFEDTCESLGSTSGGKYLGTFGDFGSYSFYYSHHITSGEGGMVVCHTEEDYDLLKCLRSHGWSREATNRKQLEEDHNDIDPRFLFVNLGYNLRPTEIQAAIAASQLRRLPKLNTVRNRNFEAMISAMKAHPDWDEQLAFPEASDGCEPAWFGLPCLIASRFARYKRNYLSFLTGCGIENRPIVSGNFARQPAVKLAGIDCRAGDYPGADEIHRRGFFIGVHTQPVPETTIESVSDHLITGLRNL